MPGQNFRGFAERVALVVGGASEGVGRAVALQLAFEGAYVIVSYRADDAAGAHVARELQEIGTLAHAFAADTSQPEGVTHLFEAVNGTFGRLDLLVNVAEGGASVALEHLRVETWDEVFDRDLKSMFLCMQAALPLLRQRPAPAIVNIAAWSEREGGAHVAAAQHGVVGLTEALARELSPVRVNCVTVGAAEVPPDEVARAVIYFLSPAARLVTGQKLTVGGGG